MLGKIITSPGFAMVPRIITKMINNKTGIEAKSWILYLYLYNSAAFAEYEVVCESFRINLKIGQFASSYSSMVNLFGTCRKSLSTRLTFLKDMGLIETSVHKGKVLIITILGYKEICSRNTSKASRQEAIPPKGNEASTVQELIYIDEHQEYGILNS